MDLNKKFNEIYTECGGIKEMQKAFNDFIKNRIKVGSIVKVQDWNQNYTNKFTRSKNYTVSSAYKRRLGTI